MTINKLLFTFISFIAVTIAAIADNGINSPYSRYGIGVLSDQSLSVNRQMGGLGYALHSGRYINVVNPASFSQADTLTMLFEGGFSMQNVNFEEGNKKRNARNASFDYIAMQFRAYRNIGISIGFLPYSQVGYSFTTGIEGDPEGKTSFNGEGGIYQPFVGIGWAPSKNLSVGLMASYIYGNISHSIINDFGNVSTTDEGKSYQIDVRSYKIDLGVQYSLQIAGKRNLTLGAVYSLGHDLNADAIQIRNVTKSDTTRLNGAFKLPHTIGVGAVYEINSKWKAGIDYTFQDWGSSAFLDGNSGTARSKVSVGAEYSPGNFASRNILKKINYRFGAYYAQPYTEIKGQKGCDEYGLSAGFSMPIINKINNRSMLHISGQVVRMEPKGNGFIAETYLRLNIGITFNESWFMKMKLR